MEKGTINVQSENIFPIIKKFLYSDTEIFLRELVSNAVDASQKLMTLVGFSKDVVLRKRLYFEGKFTDLILYSCLRENYRQD